jgi:diguanylate cyclase (GGDEF)-like protein
MLSLHKSMLLLVAIALLIASLCYGYLGEAKSMAQWRWMDIAGEGGTAIMAGVWLMMTLSSRPRGLVTQLLSFGLAFIMLGAWCDCMDEFYKIHSELRWDHWCEAIFTPLGMLLLTMGLYYWRDEQFSLNYQMQKRERLFRDHRNIDRVTHLANAQYLRKLLQQQMQHSPTEECSIALLDIEKFHRINRDYGHAEGNRVLQAVAHMVLLNLSNQEVLCRYAGDRFAIVMPNIGLSQAKERAQHICSMVDAMHYYLEQQRIPITMRAACATSQSDIDVLLSQLNQAMENFPAMQAA